MLLKLFATNQSFSQIVNKNLSKDYSSLDDRVYVPDSATAVKVAEAIWYAMFGDEIYKETPSTAILKDNVWIVTGASKRKILGGTLYAEIRRDNCRVEIAGHWK